MDNKRLKALRSQTNYSQEDVGKLIGISRTTYASYEQGHREPDNATLIKLAKLFNVTADYLLGVENLIPVTYDDIINVPLIGTVRAGVDGLAYEEFEGFTSFLSDDVESGKEYFALKVKGDSMIGDGINPGDIALIQKDAEFVQGKIYVVIIDNEEATLKHVIKSDEAIILQASNQLYPTKIITGGQKCYIAGRLTRIKRNY